MIYNILEEIAYFFLHWIFTLLRPFLFFILWIIKRKDKRTLEEKTTDSLDSYGITWKGER